MSKSIRFEVEDDQFEWLSDHKERHGYTWKGLMLEGTKQLDAAPPAEEPPTVETAAGWSVGTVLQHVTESVETMTPRSSPRWSTDGGNGWDLSDALGYDNHITDVAPETRREAALFEKGRWTQLTTIRDELVDMKDFAGGGRCHQCGEYAQLLHPEYKGPSDPEKWYKARIMDFEYYCNDCHPANLEND